MTQDSTSRTIHLAGQESSTSVPRMPCDIFPRPFRTFYPGQAEVCAVDSLPSSNSMSKPFPIAVVVRIVGNASGPIGIGITLTGWLNPLIGVGALMIGAGYVIWELSALDAVKHNVPGMLRLLAVVMIAAVTVGLSWRPIRAAVTKNTLQPHIPTAAEIAAEVWKHRPQDRPTLSTITPRPAPKGI